MLKCRCFYLWILWASLIWFLLFCLFCFFKKNYLLYSVISAPYTGERARTLLQKKSTELPDPVEALTFIILQPYKNDYIKL